MLCIPEFQATAEKFDLKLGNNNNKYDNSKLIAISIYNLSTQLLSQSLKSFSLIQTHQPQLSSADCNHHNNQSLSEIRLKKIDYFNYFGLRCLKY